MVGKHGDERVIAEYVKDQGSHFLKLQWDEQLTLF